MGTQQRSAAGLLRPMSCSPPSTAPAGQHAVSLGSKQNMNYPTSAEGPTDSQQPLGRHPGIASTNSVCLTPSRSSFDSALYCRFPGWRASPGKRLLCWSVMFNPTRQQVLARVTVVNFTVKLREISSSLWGGATRKWRGRSKVRNIFALTRNLMLSPCLVMASCGPRLWVHSNVVWAPSGYHSPHLGSHETSRRAANGWKALRNLMLAEACCCPLKPTVANAFVPWTYRPPSRTIISP